MLVLVLAGDDEAEVVEGINTAHTGFLLDNPTFFSMGCKWILISPPTPTPHAPQSTYSRTTLIIIIHILLLTLTRIRR